MHFPGEGPISTRPPVMSGVLRFASWMGVLLIVAGAILGFGIFVGIYRAINEPAPVSGMLDRWEAVIQGTEHDGSTVSLVIDPDGVFLLEKDRAADDMPTSPTVAAETGKPVSPAASIELSIVRSFGVFVVILLVGLLMRIALGFITVGVKLVGLANPYRDLYKSALAEMRAGRNRSSSRNGDESDVL